MDLIKRREQLTRRLSNPEALTDEVWEAWKRLNYLTFRHYPSISKQLELQSDDAINAESGNPTNLWLTSIMLVKEEFPKPLPGDAAIVSVLEYPVKEEVECEPLQITVRPNRIQPKGDLPNAEYNI